MGDRYGRRRLRRRPWRPEGLNVSVAAQAASRAPNLRLSKAAAAFDHRCAPLARCNFAYQSAALDAAGGLEIGTSGRSRLVPLSRGYHAPSPIIRQVRCHRSFRAQALESSRAGNYNAATLKVTTTKVGDWLIKMIAAYVIGAQPCCWK
jgi:hypothetical protein